MGFTGRVLGRRITKALDEMAESPEGQAVLEHDRRKMELSNAVRQIAGTALDDDAACAELRGYLPEDPHTARYAIEHLGALRTSYLDDRAYRLLTAAVDGTPVRPIDPAVREQFLAEAELGRMSLSDAFAFLSSLEPRLTADAARASVQPPRKQGFSFGRSDPPIVGAWAKSPHAIINTELAASVVREYGLALRAGLKPDDDATPFFERKKRSFGHSFAVFGNGDTHPRAAN